MSCQPFSAPLHRLCPNPPYSHAADAVLSPFHPQMCSDPDRHVPWATCSARSRDMDATLPTGCAITRRTGCARSPGRAGPSDSRRCRRRRHSTVRLGARRRDELDPRHHPFVGASKSSTRRKSHPAGHLLPITAAGVAVGTVSRMPVSAPGGRTTTHRFGRPSFVSDGESSTNSKPSTSTKNSMRVVLVDDDRDQLDGRTAVCSADDVHRPVAGAVGRRGHTDTDAGVGGAEHDRSVRRAVEPGLQRARPDR